MDDYYDLGTCKRTVTTSPEAQTWFDRGLNWLYGFNHAEAIKCFEKALEHDPNCAMAHWGISYAAGRTTISLGIATIRPARSALEASYDAMQRALAALPHASPVEQALTRALPARYPQREVIEDQTTWDKAFTVEMRKPFQSHPHDLDLRSVFAEAIMNETPWQMWDLKTGQPTPGAGTDEAVDKGAAGSGFGPDQDVGAGFMPLQEESGVGEVRLRQLAS